MSPTRVIRKIIIGDNPVSNGMAYVVGNSVVGSGYKIVSIIEDTNSFVFNGVARICIYISNEEFKDVLWKAYERVPVSIEYSLPIPNTKDTVLA